MLKEGIILKQEKRVLESETASKVASGGLEVFSTPMLIAFMENTAYNLVQEYLECGDTTVGIAVNIEHLKANLVGDKIECIAKLEKIDGKKLDFDLIVTYNDEIVGRGKHSRFIVNIEKFVGKLKR